MKRHHYHSLGNPDDDYDEGDSWTPSPGAQPTQHTGWDILSFSTPPSIQTTTSQNLSSQEQAMSPPCNPTSLLTSKILPLSVPTSSTESPSSTSKSTPNWISPSPQIASTTSNSHTIIASASPGNALAASFSITSTSTILQIITTSSPSSPPSSSTLPISSLTPPPLVHPSHNSVFLPNLSTPAKIALLVALTLVLLLLAIFSILLYKRHKRRSARYSAAYSQGQQPMSYTQETQPLTVSMPEPYNRIGVKVIESGEPKMDIDEDGVRWPEKVVLGGDAKEIWEWTLEVGRSG